jgi:hypothetical protein
MLSFLRPIMKEQFKVIKHNPKDPYNIQHLFTEPKKKGFLSKIKDTFSFKRKQSTTFTSEVRFWLKWNVIYIAALFLSANIALIPSLIWHIVQIAGSLAGFILVGKIYQLYQSNKAYSLNGKKFDREMWALSIISAIFILLPYIEHFH